MVLLVCQMRLGKTVSVSPIFLSGVVSVGSLEGVKDTLSQQSKSSPSKHHPLDKFDSGHLAFPKLAGSGNTFEHSVLNLWRIMSTEFTQTVCGDSLLEQLSIRSMILLLKIEGNCSHLRAKPAHLGGHLPPVADCIDIADWCRRANKNQMHIATNGIAQIHSPAKYSQRK